MNQYLTIEGLAAYLSYSPSVAYKNWRRWAAEGLRVYMINKTPRFRTSDVDSWAEKKRRLVMA